MCYYVGEENGRTTRHHSQGQLLILTLNKNLKKLVEDKFRQKRPRTTVGLAAHLGRERIMAEFRPVRTKDFY